MVLGGMAVGKRNGSLVTVWGGEGGGASGLCSTLASAWNGLSVGTGVGWDAGCWL
jgi:hypothetical protein